MKHIVVMLAAVALLMGCSQGKETNTMSSIKEKAIAEVIDSLKTRISDTGSNGLENEAAVNPLTVDASLIEKGVRNAARFWRAEDGTEAEFIAFCLDKFIVDGAAKEHFYQQFTRNLEIMYGRYNQISLRLKEPVQLAGIEYTPLDEAFAALDPYAHVADDFFASKIAFQVLLNFPFYTLDEKNSLGGEWSRLDWAYARLGDIFASRIPAELNQRMASELATTENYISNYNIRMDKLRNDAGEQLFADGMSLITHWGLRDELKANYADPVKGLEKQTMIYEVMRRIINQDIPSQVINNGELTWNPLTNKVFDKDVDIKATPEPNTRYERLLASFHAAKALDAYSPSYPTALLRAFNRDMEVSAADIEAIFTKLIASPQVGQVAALIKQRLGRELKPFDLWYDGFKSRSSINEDLLSAKTRALYPTTMAFEKGMPDILVKLGFNHADASSISKLVTVDNSRGSGHAWGAQMKGDKAHLRTRLQPGGMDYKGYNIALHEFGHNVEQVISLHDVDHYILNGIPSTAFTEALAFVFQKRDLQVLGFENAGTEKKVQGAGTASAALSAMDLQTLDIFWGCYEIMGVSLVDMKVWQWLYENPDATAEDLKATVIRIASELWNAYYEPFLGEKDSPLLAIYSHMIEYPLYLSNYPYGHIVEFQLEKLFGNTLPGKEIQRIYPTGRVTPDFWMKAAVGAPVSVDPLLEATANAVK